ncbi:MAG: glycosyltransferase family 4 protein [Candidatus Gracilibacteria bacterium]
MIKDKNILLISPRFVYPPNDGAKIVIFNTIKELSKLNNIDYITNISEEDYTYLEGIKPFINNSFYIDKDATKQNLFLLLKSFIFCTSYLFLKYYNKKILNKIDDFFSKNNYDIVWLESAFSTLYAKHIRSKYPNVKIISRSHNTECVLLSRIGNEEKNVFKKYLINREAKFWKKIEIDYFNYVDKILPISPADKDYFISRKSDIFSKTEVLYPGVDTEKYNNNQGITNKKNIVFMGALNYFPNIQGINWFLKEIFPKVLEKDNEIKLIIVGNNALENLEEYKNNKNIEIVNGTNDDVKYFNKAKIFIVPLLSGSGIKIKVLTSMSMGKAVISTQVGVEGLDISNGENIIVCDNNNEWVGSILSLINNDEGIKKLGINARKFILKNFSWEETFRILNI